MEKNIEKAADTLKSEVDKKVDEIHCDDRYENLLSRLGRGVDRFDTIDEMLEKQSKLLIGHATMLGEINGKLSVLIKNGNGNRSESKS